MDELLKDVEVNVAVEPKVIKELNVKQNKDFFERQESIFISLFSRPGICQSKASHDWFEHQKRHLHVPEKRSD